jgi:hypothetical protein
LSYNAGFSIDPALCYPEIPENGWSEIMFTRNFFCIFSVLIFCFIIIPHAMACLHVYHIDPPSVIQWEQNTSGSYGEKGYDIHETCDGGYIITGTIDQSPKGTSGSSGIFIRKLDAGQNVSWERVIGGTGKSEGRKIRETRDGGYFVVGMTTSSDVDFKGRNNGKWDVVAAKLNASGTLEWVRNYGGSNDDFGENIRLTKDGAVIIGRTFSNDTDVSPRANYTLGAKKGTPEIPQRTYNNTRGISSDRPDDDVLAYLLDDTLRESREGQSDIWIMEIDDRGDILWQQRYGGSRDDYGYDILPLDNSRYLVAGISFSNDGDLAGKNFGEDSGTSDGWFFTLNRDHMIDWQNSLGGSGNEGFFSMETTEYPTGGGGCIVSDYSVVYRRHTGYILSGFAESRDGDVFPRPMKDHESYDGWIVIINPELNVSWTQCIGGSRFDVITSSKQTNIGKEVFSGITFSSDGDIFRSNKSGSYLLPMVGLYNRGDSMIDWMIFPGNNETGLVNSVIIAQDGGYLTAGWTARPDGPGKSNISVLRLSAPPQPTILTSTGNNTSITTDIPRDYDTLESIGLPQAPSPSPAAAMPVGIPVAAAICAALAVIVSRDRKT